MENSNSKSREILYKSSWSSQYRIDVRPYLEFLSRDKWYVSQAAQALLNNFGGIEISSPDRPGRYLLKFDPIGAANYNSRWVFEEIETKLGKKLCPIVTVQGGV